MVYVPASHRTYPHQPLARCACSWAALCARVCVVVAVSTGGSHSSVFGVAATCRCSINRTQFGSPHIAPAECADVLLSSGRLAHDQVRVRSE
jgi:hypothetical protein